MGPLRALRRAAHEVRRHGVRAFLLAGGVAIGVALIVFLLAFVAGTRKAIMDRVVSSLPITHLTVVPRASSGSRARSPSSTTGPSTGSARSTAWSGSCRWRVSGYRPGSEPTSTGRGS